MVHKEATYEPGKEIKTLADTYNHTTPGSKNQVPDNVSTIPPPKNKNNFGAENQQLLPKTKENWRRAKDYQKYLAKNYSPKEHARLYFAKFPNFPHDYFKKSTRAENKKLGKALTGKGQKLLNQLGTQGYLYSLHMNHLGLPLSYTDPRFIYYPLVVDHVKAAIAERVPQPYHWQLEVGECGRVHVHLLGPAPGPQLAHLLFEGSRVIEPAWGPAGALKYTLKPMPWNEANYAGYLTARAQLPAGRRVPQLSGYVGIKNSARKKKTL